MALFDGHATGNDRLSCNQAPEEPPPTAPRVAQEEIPIEALEAQALQQGVERPGDVVHGAPSLAGVFARLAVRGTLTGPRCADCRL